MTWQDVRGHDEPIAMLRRAAARNRLAHGYLFLGPEGIGKRFFARLFAQALFCREGDRSTLESCGKCPSCRQVAAGSHPDLLEIGCPEGKRELPIDLLVGSKERRGREGLCHDLALRPMAADCRVAIIDDADLMNEESSNALLKTLEEPPPGSHLILIARDLEPILPTIRSRCQPLWFSALSTTDVAALLQAEGVAAGDAEEAAARSEGSLAVARRLMDPAIAGLRKAVQDGLRGRSIDSLALAGAVTGALEAGGSDAASQRELAGWAIEFAMDHFRDQLRDRPEGDPILADRGALSIARCADAADHLRQSMPVPLCLAGLFDDLARIGRGLLPAMA